jgi:hemoglobin-like flavoprotein
MEIQESLHGIHLRGTELANEFYSLLLNRYPELSDYFLGVQLGRQAVVLTNVLTVVVQHYCQDYPASKSYLRILGGRHEDLGIAGEDYPKFTQALMIALEQFHGSAWTDELAVQWRDAIGLAATRLMDGYSAQQDSPGRGLIHSK